MFIASSEIVSEDIDGLISPTINPLITQALACCASIASIKIAIVMGLVLIGR